MLLVSFTRYLKNNFLFDIYEHDLPPTVVMSDKLKSGVTPEEAILLVVKPHKTKFVFWIDLPIAAQVGIGLVIHIMHRYVILVCHRQNPLAEVITPVRTKQPPPVSNDGSTEARRSVQSHVKGRTGVHKSVFRLLYASLESCG